MSTSIIRVIKKEQANEQIKQSKKAAVTCMVGAIICIASLVVLLIANLIIQPSADNQNSIGETNPALQIIPGFLMLVFLGGLITLIIGFIFAVNKYKTLKKSNSPTTPTSSTTHYHSSSDASSIASTVEERPF